MVMIQRKIIHLVKRFIAGIGVTACGIHSDSVTAAPMSVTCLRCKEANPNAR